MSSGSSGTLSLHTYGREGVMDQGARGEVGGRRPGGERAEALWHEKNRPRLPFFYN